MAREIGRYTIGDALATGGMASVHLGRLRAEGRFTRLVAVKILREAFAADAAQRAMFLDEARIVSHIRHANVVSTLDVLEDRGELLLVMDYVDGPPLSRVMKDVLGGGGSVPVPVVVTIVCDVLEGLHAAHEARSDRGEALGVVHRDVSPQNVMIGRDGSARVVDFGIARAADRDHATVPGDVKGKAAYMAPEQARGEALDRRADVYAAAIVAWELLAGARLFAAESFAGSILKQLELQPDAPSTRRPEIGPALDAAVLRGLEKQPDRRFATAREMAMAIEAASPRATRAEVAEWLARVAARFFEERDAFLAHMETRTRVLPAPHAEAPTRIERLPTQPSLPDMPGAGRRPARAVAAIALFAAIGATAFLAWRAPRKTEEMSKAPAAAVPSPPTAIALPSAPIVVVSTPLAAIDGKADAATGAAVPTSTPRYGGRAAAPRPPASTASPTPSLSPPPLPPCCVGGIQIRFGACDEATCPKK